MSTEEALSVILSSSPLDQIVGPASVVQYSHGLKSAAMMIGKDMLLFTKKDGVLTCLLLSQSFHEKEKGTGVIVPLVAYRANDRTPVAPAPNETSFKSQVDIIVQNSPFKSEADLKAQFDGIKGSSGTLCVLFNMNLRDRVDVSSDNRDIILKPTDNVIQLIAERRSLQAFVSILYLDPHMKVYLRGHRVHAKRLIANPFKLRAYVYTSSTMNAIGKREVEKAQEELNMVREKHCEATEKYYQQREAPAAAKELLWQETESNSKIVTFKNLELTQKKEEHSKDKTVQFLFGINAENRSACGMFLYSCSRLVKGYQLIGPQKVAAMKCRGVVGIVDFSPLLLEASNNKESFANNDDFNDMMATLADYLLQYWDDICMNKTADEAMWYKYGYKSLIWREPPSIDDASVKKRANSITRSVQCNVCYKWRVISHDVTDEDRDTWACTNHTDTKLNRCALPEKPLTMPIIPVQIIPKSNLVKTK